MVLTKKERFISATKAYFTTRRIAYLGVFSALASIFYIFISIRLPIIFPSFLSLDLSDIPVLIAGFMLGPIGGVIVVLFRMIVKLSFGLSGTGGIGELSDLILGIAFVLPAALIYKRWRTHKGAVVGLVIGILGSTGLSILSNWLVIVPLFVRLGGGWDRVLGALQAIHPSATEETFFRYYLTFAVVPFNLLRTIVSAAATYVIYSGLKRADKRLFGERKKKTTDITVNSDTLLENTKFISKSENDTLELGKKLAVTLKLGDIVLLSGDVGAGKTVFSKGVCLGFKINEAVLSPTFTIMNVYDLKAGEWLCHIDAYRLKNENEALEAGLGDYIGDKSTVTLVEWHENIEEMFTDKKCVRVKISVIDENDREIEIL